MKNIFGNDAIHLFNYYCSRGFNENKPKGSSEIYKKLICMSDKKYSPYIIYKYARKDNYLNYVKIMSNNIMLDYSFKLFEFMNHIFVNNYNLCNDDIIINYINNDLFDFYKTLITDIKKDKKVYENLKNSDECDNILINYKSMIEKIEKKRLFKNEKFLLKLQLFKELLFTFFPNGLYDTSAVIVGTLNKDVSQSQLDFFDKYVLNIRSFFNDIRYIKKNCDELKITNKKITPYKLVSWLSIMFDKIFATKIDTFTINKKILMNHIEKKILNISSETIIKNRSNGPKKFCRIRKGDINGHYYCCNFDMSKFIEVAIYNKYDIIDKNIINMLIERYSQKQCVFVNLHNCNTFEELVNHKIVNKEIKVYDDVDYNKLLVKLNYFNDDNLNYILG